MENNKATFIFSDVEWDGIFYTGEDLKGILLSTYDVDPRVDWEVCGEGFKIFVSDWSKSAITHMAGPDCLETFLGWLFENGYGVEQLIDAF